MRQTERRRGPHSKKLLTKNAKNVIIITQNKEFFFKIFIKKIVRCRQGGGVFTVAADILGGVMIP